jgi:hypothetical protein
MMTCRYATDNDNFYSAQKRVIDLAHRIDPNFAASIASLIDNDPARAKARKELMERLRILNIKKEIGDSRIITDDTIKDPKEYSSAAWMNLGALNSGRLDTLNFESARSHLVAAAELPFSESYSVFAWTIENFVRRFENTEQASTHLVPIFDAALLGIELSGKISANSFNRSKVYSSVLKRGETQALVIAAGEREKAIEFLKHWCLESVEEYIKICDPYFGINDLELLKIFQSVQPNCRFYILTSRKQQEHDKVSAEVEEAFRRHWRIRISNQDAPVTEILVAGLEADGSLPIHDRWLITKNSGMTIGTSFNSLGLNKTSEVKILDADEAMVLERELDQYISREKREYNRQRIRYTLFTL